MSSHNQPFCTLEKEALICARCGYCKNVCPIYQNITWESATPRGKISIAREIFSFKKDKKLTDEYVERITQCTLCGACSQACSADINVRDLWLELRNRIAKIGKSPKGYNFLHQNLIKNHNITTFDNEDRLEWAEDLDDPESLEPRKGADVCYFVGCVSSFMPQASEVAISFAEVLLETGIQFTTLGGDEWCCGFPLLGTGNTEDAKKFMKHNFERIKDLEIHTIVTTCPSCYGVWKQGSKEFLEDYKLEVYHASEYLLKLINEGKIKLGELNEIITYHDPCDLGRNEGIFQEPRDIITSIPDVTFVELEHNRFDSLCCGGGGNLQSVDPDLSNSIADKRTEEILESGATILVSACQQCEQVLSGSLKRKGSKVRVMNITQLILEIME